ncbi:hypothetical protein BY996DRAFT_6633557 [Phakopsora pachyrhizi]|uniref:Uncharacterized protein n=1 Tax=Phakopsora pachyrhizi TaxID=170000 RepID=A0AAV0AFT4_PHAPC|nr:hypothetical protein BY996DRAFT_6633557 [Phakopsora pachyrhizi]CAH7667010.1 hypothetical protein PPACK8108_LOCUS1383 [Phakopsora pachyrhizi]
MFDKKPKLLSIDDSHLIRVSDSNQEIFELYSNLNSINDGGKDDEDGSALGFLDSQASILSIQIEVQDPSTKSRNNLLIKKNNSNNDGADDSNHTRDKKGKIKRLKNRRTIDSESYRSSEHQKGRLIQANIYQDIQSIHHRRGDTGSILWRSTLHLSQLLWYDLLYPPPSNDSQSTKTLLDMSLLITDTRILELGSGTGSLAILCDSMFPKDSSSSSSSSTLSSRTTRPKPVFNPSSTTWTLSDRSDQLQTIVKNFRLNCSTPNIPDRYTIQEIDWLEVEKAWSRRRSKIDANQKDISPSSSIFAEFNGEGFDLILVVDCIYHENLILPLIRTIDHLSKPSNDSSSATLVLVVSELRSHEISELFISSWLDLHDWNIFRINSQKLRNDIVDLKMAKPRYAIWCGWKKN